MTINFDSISSHISIDFHFFYFEYHRKDTVEIIEIFNNTTVHSLNLRQQQKVADEMNIIKKKNKKGTSYKSTSRIKYLLNCFY